MKYRKRVFAMDAAELRAALSLLCPERHDLLVGPADRGTLQEELVQWLLSEGLSARHEFLLYREDSPQNESNYEDGVEQEEEQKVWLLSRRTRGCPCCDASDGQRASPMPSPCPTPAERRSPSPRPQQQKQKQQPPAKVERPRKEATAEASRGRKAHNTGMPSNSRQTTQQIGTFVPSLLSVPRKGDRTAVTAVVTVQPMPGQQQDKKEVPQKKKSMGEECCVECGHFCVDLISTLK